MYRKPPAASPILHRALHGTVILEREYTLITPLFGGGVSPARQDPVSAVRASSVRGQLRFWWRATRGGSQAGTSADMFEREASIWGAASTPKNPSPSQVQVVVTQCCPGTAFPATRHNGQPAPHIGHYSSHDSYAAFPLREGGTVQQDVGFTLRLTMPATVEPDVVAALWAWQTFGGLGARTRRGFGALSLVRARRNGSEQPVAPPNDRDAAREAVRAGLAEHVVSGTWPDDVPHLPREDKHWRIAGPATDAVDAVDAVAAWRHLIAQLKQFRHQRPNNGRGRNRWPEPDEIRRLAGRCMPAHCTPVLTVHKFPRAQFGLPILYQFKQDQQHKGEPRGSNLLTGKPGPNPADRRDRLASPLILRPLRLAKGQAVGVALRLQGVRLPPTLVIALNSGTRNVKADLTQAEAQQISASQNKLAGVRPALGTTPAPTDLIAAFLDYIG